MKLTWIFIDYCELSYDIQIFVTLPIYCSFCQISNSANWCYRISMVPYFILLCLFKFLSIDV